MKSIVGFCPDSSFFAAPNLRKRTASVVDVYWLQSSPSGVSTSTLWLLLLCRRCLWLISVHDRLLCAHLFPTRIRPLTAWYLSVSLLGRMGTSGGFLVAWVRFLEVDLVEASIAPDNMTSQDFKTQGRVKGCTKPVRARNRQHAYS